MINILKTYFDKRLYSCRTPLCEIFKKYNSDKSGIRHNYSTLYNHIFNELNLVDKPINLFEIGLGTNNTDVKSNMGITGTPGASLRAFKEYFANANIYGADIDKRILFEEERIKTFYCDQTSSEDIRDLWQQIDAEFDIIIDDGLHEPHANITFFENSFHKLKEGGVYIIEDIIVDNRKSIVNFLNDVNCNFKSVIDLPIDQNWANGKINSIDNIVAIIVK